MARTAARSVTILARSRSANARRRASSKAPLFAASPSAWRAVAARRSATIASKSDGNTARLDGVPVAGGQKLRQSDRVETSAEPAQRNELSEFLAARGEIVDQSHQGVWRKFAYALGAKFRQTGQSCLTGHVDVPPLARSRADCFARLFRPMREQVGLDVVLQIRRADRAGSRQWHS